MTAATSHIDLGELSHGEQPGNQPAWPGWRGLADGRWRWGLAVAVTALTLAGLTAAAPVRPPFELRFTAQAANFAVDRTHLYTLDPRGPGSVLTAHRLADGGVAWRASLPADPAEIGIGSFHDEAPLLVHYRHDPETDSVSAVEPATGETRWTADGSVAAVTGQLLLLRRPSAPEPQPATDLAHSDLEVDYLAVDIRTGEPRWRIERGSPKLETNSPDPTHAVMLTRAGELRSYDLRTGALLATASTGSADGGSHQLRLAGDTVLLEQEPGDGPGPLRAYDLPSLRQRWTIREPAPAESLWSANSCGELLCRFDSGQVRAIRLDDGALAWSIALPDDSMPSWVSAGPFPDYLVLSAMPAVMRNRERFYSRDWLLDPATGETVLDLAGWRLMPDLTGESDHGAWVVENRAASTWVGRLRPDLSGIEPIGRVGRADSCWGVPSGLVCRRDLDDRSLTEITVWQFRGE